MNSSDPNDKDTNFNSDWIKMSKKEEPMFNIDKYYIMSETQTFNNHKF